MKGQTLAALSLFSSAVAEARSSDRVQRPKRSGAHIEEYASTTVLDTVCETEFHPDQLDIAWVEAIATSTILRVNVTDGEVTRFPLKNTAGLPSGMEFLADGKLWFSEVVGNNMVQLDPKDGSMTEYAFPWTNLTLVDDLPVGIRVTIDVSGNRDRGAWFTAAGLNAIGRLDIDTHEFELFPLPNALSVPLIIQGGPGNTMAFSELLGNRIGTIDVTTKEIKEYEIPTPLSLVQGVSTADDGTIWWTGTQAGTIGTVNVETGEVTEINIAAVRAAGNSTVIGEGLSGAISTSALLPFPGPIRQGGDGKIYFAMGNLVWLGNRIGQYDPTTQQLVEYIIPSNAASPCDLNGQHSDAIYFAEMLTGKMGRLDFY